MTDNIQDNGPTDKTVETEDTLTHDANNISDRLRDILFGSEQEEQQPEGSQQTGEVQTEDKAEQNSDDYDSETSESPQAEDGEDQVPLQTEETSDEEEGLPNGVQKRINKLTARNKEYEEKILALEAKMQEFEKNTSQEEQVQKEPTRVIGDNPFSNLDTIEKVSSELENARWLRFKCEENPDGFQLGETYLDANEVRQIKLNALRAIEEHLPRQAQFIQAHQEYRKVAHKEYPWYNKPETKEAQLANEVLKNFPQFRNFPDFELFVGDYVRGYMSRTAPKSQQTTARTAPNLSVKPRTAPTASMRKDATDRRDIESFAKSGGKEGLAKILLAKGFV